MPKRLEYALSSPIDPVASAAAAAELSGVPGIHEVVIESARRRLTALVDDELSSENLVKAMEGIGLYPQYQRGAFFVHPVCSCFTGAWLRRTLSRFRGVKGVKFNPVSRLLFLKYDRNLFDPKVIKETLTTKGFSAIETTALGLLRTQEGKRNLSLVRRLMVALVLALGIGVAEHFSMFRLAGILCVACVFWPGFPLMRRAFSFLSRGFLDSALPGVLVILFYFGYGIWALFTRANPLFLVPGILVVLMSAWELWENWLAGRASSMVTGFLARLTPWARVQRGGRTMEVPVDEVEKGETLIVKEGETVALDGLVIEGGGITGEGPVSPGVRVFATTRLESGWIKLTATESFPDSYHVKTLILAEEALSAGSTSRAYILLIVLSYLLVASSMVAAWFFGPGALILAALPLPQAISVATEWHRVAGVKRGLARGVIFKDAEHLHRLGRTDTLLVPLGSALGEYRFCGTEGPPELLSVASSLEDGLWSKLSRAFGPGPFSPTRRSHHRGMGVTGLLGGVSWRFGNLRFVNFHYHVPGEDDGLFPVFLESEGPEGALVFRREPRPGIQKLVKAWRKKVMVSSAPRATVSFWAKQWGIQEIYPESVPEGKRQVLSGLMSQGRKVLYFDDVPHRQDMLRGAYWGIAVADDFLDTEAGTTVITGGDLSRIPLAKRIAGRSNAAKWAGVILVFFSACGLALGWWLGFLPLAGFLILAYLLMFLAALV